VIVYLNCFYSKVNNYSTCYVAIGVNKIEISFEFMLNDFKNIDTGQEKKNKL